jgi:hypothetical protein
MLRFGPANPILSVSIPASSTMSALSPGRYQHYKGRFYTVIGVARHSETDEELVVYRPEYGERGLWVRPKAMFEESVLVDGQSVPRFRFVGPE